MKEKKFNLTGVLIIVVAIILLVYTGYDAFKVRPEIKQRVDTVTTEFHELKTYLDAKLPEIDSVLVVHTNQIKEQNQQLNELNKLTSILKQE